MRLTWTVNSSIKLLYLFYVRIKIYTMVWPNIVTNFLYISGMDTHRCKKQKAILKVSPLVLALNINKPSLFCQFSYHRGKLMEKPFLYYGNHCWHYQNFTSLVTSLLFTLNENWHQLLWKQNQELGKNEILKVILICWHSWLINFCWSLWKIAEIFILYNKKHCYTTQRGCCYRNLCIKENHLEILTV